MAEIPRPQAKKKLAMSTHVIMPELCHSFTAFLGWTGAGSQGSRGCPTVDFMQIPILKTKNLRAHFG
jgi:hypothetical protein